MQISIAIYYIDETPSERTRQKIKEKCQQYLNRAERLKMFLAKGRHKTMRADDDDDEEDQGADKKKLKTQLASTLNNTVITNLQDPFFFPGAIVQEKPNVKWDDIAGLQNAKEALKESVILPVRFPYLFTGTCVQFEDTITLEINTFIIIQLIVNYYHYRTTKAMERYSALWCKEREFHIHGYFK